MAASLPLTVKIYNIVLICFLPIAAAVFQKLDTEPVIFGQNVTLSCYTHNPVSNSKDCPVRQWTIGANTDVLLYNEFAYNPGKYVDNTNLSSDHFSLVIKNFSLLDVNQLYSCSCGFSKASKFLSLDEKVFIHKPRNSSVKFDVTNNTLQAKLNLIGVYPVPECSLFLKENTVVVINDTTNEVQHGLLYDVSTSFLYNLTETSCTKKWLPIVECKYPAGYTEQFNGSLRYLCQADKDVPKSADEVMMEDPSSPKKGKSMKTVKIAGLVLGLVLGLAVALIIGFACFYCNKRKEVHKQIFRYSGVSKNYF